MISLCFTILGANSNSASCFCFVDDLYTNGSGSFTNRVMEARETKLRVFLMVL